MTIFYLTLAPGAAFISNDTAYALADGGGIAQTSKARLFALSHMVATGAGAASFLYQWSEILAGREFDDVSALDAVAPAMLRDLRATMPDAGRALVLHAGWLDNNAVAFAYPSDADFCSVRIEPGTHSLNPWPEPDESDEYSEIYRRSELALKGEDVDGFHRVIAMAAHRAWKAGKSGYPMVGGSLLTTRIDGKGIQQYESMRFPEAIQ